ncbi:hypothetical protein [Pseudobutyrivibrio ruminis]|uniref:hypothetical protein n=1 Tax=Pseudobutyrivibrio ruminis TaxID=46206 RepID=UPI00040C0963|nr:hypothetical protein [Pseudobutyrivibrio ruminis]
MKKINSSFTSGIKLLKNLTMQKTLSIMVIVVVIFIIATYVYDVKHSSVVLQGEPNILTITNYRGDAAFSCNGLFINQGTIVNREKIKVLIDSKEYCANPGKMRIVFNSGNGSGLLNNSILCKGKGLYYDMNISSEYSFAADTIEITNHGDSESFLHKMTSGKNEDIVWIKLYNPIFNSIFQVQKNEKFKLTGNFLIIIGDDVIQSNNSEIEIVNPSMSASFYINSMNYAMIPLQNSASLTLDGNISELSVEMIPGKDRLVLTRSSKQMDYVVGAQTVVIDDHNNDLIFKYDSEASIPLNVAGKYPTVKIDNINVSNGLASFLFTNIDGVIMTIFSIFFSGIIGKVIGEKRRE